MFEEEKGKGWHGDPEGHSEAAKSRGENQGESSGTEFYSEIGRESGLGEESDNPGNFANDPERASEAGSEGGSK